MFPNNDMQQKTNEHHMNVNSVTAKNTKQAVQKGL